jgi:hypothetical protein
MDWQKVIDNLRSQTTFYTEQADKYGCISGYEQKAREMRTSANVASILASALYAGIDAPKQ